MYQTETELDSYNTRNPKNSHYYQCVENHFEELEQVWDDYFSSKFGFWRPHVLEVIQKYLDCGDLHFGFARVKCESCNHEFLVPFSCKRRHFCPSCHQKRVVEFGEFLSEEVLKNVPHRHWVFSIPKRIRIFFCYDRKLLVKLSQCAWKVLSKYLKTAVPYEDAKPGVIVSVQSFGDFLEFHPHLHIIGTDGCFCGDDSFMAALYINSKDLEEPFRVEVLNMLKKEGKISDFVVENMMSWPHSGFNVFCGNTIWPGNEEGIENLARYIVRASFSQERMVYIPIQKTTDGIAKVVYKSKDGKITKTYNALEWLAQLVTHIPNKGEQTIRYYGFYSNKSRGLRKKDNTDENISSFNDSTGSKKEFRKNWARLIQKIYNVDPLLCPKCDNQMRIIAFIEEPIIIKKILKHLNLWDVNNHDPPGNAQENDFQDYFYDDSDSQIPPNENWF